MVFPTDHDFQFSAGLPFKIHFGDRAHLNSGPIFNITWIDRSAPNDDQFPLLFSVPIEFAYNVSRAFYFGFTSGFSFVDFDPDPPNPVIYRVSSGGFIGYTAFLNRSAIDFGLDLTFPSFVHVIDGDADLTLKHWQLIFGAVFRIATR